MACEVQCNTPLAEMPLYKMLLMAIAKCHLIYFVLDNVRIVVLRTYEEPLLLQELAFTELRISDTSNDYGTMNLLRDILSQGLQSCALHSGTCLRGLQQSSVTKTPRP